MDREHAGIISLLEEAANLIGNCKRATGKIEPTERG